MGECRNCKKKVAEDCLAASLRSCPPTRKMCRTILVRRCKKDGGRPCRVVRRRKKNCSFTWKTIGEVEVMQEVPGSCESENTCEGTSEKCTMIPRKKCEEEKPPCKIESQESCQERRSKVCSNLPACSGSLTRRSKMDCGGGRKSKKVEALIVPAPFSRDNSY